MVSYLTLPMNSGPGFVPIRRVWQGVRPFNRLASPVIPARDPGDVICGVVVKRFAAIAIVVALALPPGPVLGAAVPGDTPIDQLDWGQTPEYRIVPGDVLGLNFGPSGEDLSTDVVRQTEVRIDGRITVFPIGDVVAAGHTPVELQAELIRLLAAEFKQPRVTVEVMKSAASRVHVLGRVKRPGSQVVQSLPTLLQVIAEAGGFEDDAARNSVIVMHRVGLGTVSATRIRAGGLLRGGGDVPLSRFDIVYVPRSTIGNVDVFVQQFFGGFASPIVNTALTGWELFNLDRVFAPIRVVDR
jgi:protein involved in polysaccharide export with SLBB domain